MSCVSLLIHLPSSSCLYPHITLYVHALDTTDQQRWFVPRRNPMVLKERDTALHLIVGFNVSDRLPWKTLSGDRNPLKLNVTQLSWSAVGKSQLQNSHDYSVQISPRTFQLLTPGHPLLSFVRSPLISFKSCYFAGASHWHFFCGGCGVEEDIAVAWL